jgi:hypothetical protein
MTRAKNGPRNIERIAVDSHADRVGLNRFTDAMLARLDEARNLDGRGGWNRVGECSIERLTELYNRAIASGNLVNVANYAMMIWNRRNPTGDTNTRG